MKIAIVGAGLFGCLTAVKLAEAGHSVTIYEQNTKIMYGATMANQQRLHMGFHYPRSPETIRDCMENAEIFTQEFPHALFEGDQYYCIASEGSKVTADHYTRVMERHKLPFFPADPDFLESDAIDLAIKVPETRVDSFQLYVDLFSRIDNAGVVLMLGKPATKAILDEYDHVVVAAYAGTNNVLKTFGLGLKPLKYQCVEKPLVALPRHYANTGFVLMDGEFFCVDPFGRTSYHALGHVTASVHYEESSVGPDLPAPFMSQVGKGIVRDYDHTRNQQMIRKISKVFPDMKRAVHIGSLYTVRVTLPDVEDTDERLSHIWHPSEQVTCILSGKLSSAPRVAAQVVQGMV